MLVVTYRLGWYSDLCGSPPHCALNEVLTHVGQFKTFFFKGSALWADAFYKSICLYVCLSVCSFLEFPFNVLFAPTSQSRMSNIFRDSESLGGSNGKKWSHIWTFLFESGLKFPRKKKVFFVCWFCLTKHVGNHTSQWMRDLWLKGISLILASF